MKVSVELGALSDPGKVRKNNEDHYLVAQFQRTMRPLLTNLPAGTVPDDYEDTAYGMLVADGMGGRAAGEVASRTAIGTLVRLALETPDWILRFDDQSAEQVLGRMDERFQKLRDVLIEQAVIDPKLAGMGTTMTLAMSVGADLIISHIGDTRVYLFRDGELHRLTRDQTIVQSLVDAGAIRPEDVSKHPMRHVLTGVITTKKGNSKVELEHLKLKHGDQILLSSDGLTDMVPDAAIADVLSRNDSAGDACRALVERALEAGGKDNVTVLVGKYRIDEQV
jgi:serine/threonine protein phosphatase PrpC